MMYLTEEIIAECTEPKGHDGMHYDQAFSRSWFLSWASHMSNTSNKTAYADFLGSPLWQGKRKARLALDHWKCQQCGSEANLDVHHLNYDRPWGQEKMADLLTLCRSCHYQTPHPHREQRMDGGMAGSELELLNNADLRAQYASRTDVLLRVKPFQMVEGTQHATLKTLAEDFGVSIGALKNVIDRNRSELERNGFMTLTRNQARNMTGRFIYGFPALSASGGGVQKLSFVPPKAILNIAFLLQESSVARTIRTMVLDRTFQDYSPSPPVQSDPAVPEMQSFVTGDDDLRVLQAMIGAIRQTRDEQRRQAITQSAQGEELTGVREELASIREELIGIRGKVETGGTDRGNLVLQFGKYKALCARDVLNLDPGYVYWCLDQGWFQDRQPILADFWATELDYGTEFPLTREAA